MEKILIGAIDQGTSSTRFLVFSAKDLQMVTYHQVPINLITKKSGWVEIDPMQIVESVLECIEKCSEHLNGLGLSYKSIKIVGVTNQRETTILWDKITGKPLYNAIVWLDTRTSTIVDELLLKCPDKNPDYLKKQCGLPISTYFSALKIKWLIDNVPEVKDAIAENRCAFGTVDSWLLWNLIGDKSCHVTDCTNASRTMLMNLKTLDWDDDLCKFFGIPRSILPEIRSSAERYGAINQGCLKNIPILSVLGDQQAALLGQLCWTKGSAKNTYGTGCFLLYNTGSEIVYSKHGLLTTVGYKLGKDKAVYALEGSVAIAGACMNWLVDNLNILNEAKDSEEVASKVEDTGDVYFVPAFSGLFAPYWRADARGLIIGITQYTTKAHIVRAALEAVAFQNYEIVEAMNLDSKINLPELQVSGGMTSNKLLLQMQADILGVPVVKPNNAETTSFGAALAAGKAFGLWDLEDPKSISIINETYIPSISEESRKARYHKWKKAVQRSIGWDETNIKDDRSTFRKIIERINPVILIGLPFTAIVLYKIIKY